MKVAIVVSRPRPRSLDGGWRELAAVALGLSNHAGLDVEVVAVDGTPPGIAGIPVLPLTRDAVHSYVSRHVGERFWLFSPASETATLVGAGVDPEHSAIVPYLSKDLGDVESHAFVFRRVRGVVLQSRVEMQRAQRLFRMRVDAPVVIGPGVDDAPAGVGGRFAERRGLSEYLVCRDPGASELATMARRLARHRASRRLALVVAGPALENSPGSGIVTVEPDSEDWRDACAGALALCGTSGVEGAPAPLFEAWREGTPVLVSADDPVAVEHCLESDGGLLFRSEDEFDAALDLLCGDSATRRALGAQGRRYVEQHFSRGAVVDRYVAALRRWGMDVAALSRPDAPNYRPRPRPRARAIHQLVTGFRSGDAISNEALMLQGVFRSWGIASDIFAVDRALDAPQEAFGLPEFVKILRPDDVVVYHHALHSAAVEAFIQSPARRVLVYHNITPARFFAGYSRQHEILSELGRHWLPLLVQVSERLFADSEFNAAELRQAGAGNVRVLPVVQDLQRLDAVVPDPNVMARCQGVVNVLFVGRVVPNKRQDDVIEAFAAYHRRNPGARLRLVGNDGDPAFARYVERLRDTVRQHGLAGSVEFAGGVSDAALVAYYRTADVFLCLSEHEGFGVPLLESMFFEVPLVAYAAGAVQETLGSAGILLDDKNPGAVAEAIDHLVRDADHRKQTVEAQRRRLQDFAPQPVLSMLRHELSPLVRGDEMSA